MKRGCFVVSLIVVVSLGMVLLNVDATEVQVTTGCPYDGDVNGDGRRTPADALLAFQHFLQIIQLDACQQDRADVLEPVDPGSNITPADALCIFKAFLGKPSCLDDKTFDFILDVSRLDSDLYRLR